MAPVFGLGSHPHTRRNTMLTYADRDDAFAFDAADAEELAYEQYVSEIEYELWVAQAQAQQDENDEFWSEEEPTYFLEEGWNDSATVTQPSSDEDDFNQYLTEDQVEDLFINDDEYLEYISYDPEIRVITKCGGSVTLAGYIKDYFLDLLSKKTGKQYRFMDYDHEDLRELGLWL